MLRGQPFSGNTLDLYGAIMRSPTFCPAWGLPVPPLMTSDLLVWDWGCNRKKAHASRRTCARQRPLACSHKPSRSITSPGTTHDSIFLLLFQLLRAEPVLARCYRFMYRALRRASARVFSWRSVRKSPQFGSAPCVTQRETDVPLAAVPMELGSSGRGAPGRDEAARGARPCPPTRRRGRRRACLRSRHARPSGCLGRR